MVEALGSVPTLSITFFLSEKKTILGLMNLLLNVILKLVTDAVISSVFLNGLVVALIRKCVHDLY